VKLYIKRINGNGPLALHDEDGRVLPGQHSLVIRSVPEDIVKAEVVFLLGDDVEIVGENDRPR
jgi:hypothetical protein